MYLVFQRYQQCYIFKKWGLLTGKINYFFFFSIQNILDKTEKFLEHTN